MNKRGATLEQEVFSKSIKNWTPEMIANPSVAMMGMEIDKIQSVQNEYNEIFGQNSYGGRVRKEEENGIYPC